jgi:hypothetical protein
MKYSNQLDFFCSSVELVEHLLNDILTSNQSYRQVNFFSINKNKILTIYSTGKR